mmetsp:Transcript_17338/g.53317  ORF Transcript_17338/g.53317 Transcript_17338/m.53317 type:complete len:213 (-) Transcript_17338:318-956(-)
MEAGIRELQKAGRDDHRPDRRSGWRGIRSGRARPDAAARGARPRSFERGRHGVRAAARGLGRQGRRAPREPRALRRRLPPARQPLRRATDPALLVPRDHRPDPVLFVRVHAAPLRVVRMVARPGAAESAQRRGMERAAPFADHGVARRQLALERPLPRLPRGDRVLLVPKRRLLLLAAHRVPVHGAPRGARGRHVLDLRGRKPRAPERAAGA